MSTSELVVALTDDLAWPLVAIVAIVVLRLADLDFKGYGMEARVRRTAEEKYRRESQQAQAALEPGLEPPTRQGIEPKRKGADGLFLDSYTRLSDAVVERLGRGDVTDFDDAISAAVLRGEIDDELVGALQSLQHMYRLAMFGPRGTVRSKDAREYATYVDEAIARLPS